MGGGGSPSRFPRSPERLWCVVSILSRIDATRIGNSSLARRFFCDPRIEPSSTSRRASRSGRPVPSGSSSARTSQSSTSIGVGCGSSRHAWPIESGKPWWAKNTTSASGALSSAASVPPGRGAPTGAACSARARPASWWPRCSSRSIARRRRSAVTLPPSGKISTASRAAQAAAHRRDLDLGVASARVDEPVREPPADHVDQRVERQRLVHDDPRPPAVAAEQVVEHEQRVALAGVDAEHDERPPIGQRGFGVLGAVDGHAHARDPQRRARDAAHEPAQDRVVGPVPAGEPGGPQCRARRPPRRRGRSRTRARAPAPGADGGRRTAATGAPRSPSGPARRRSARARRRG